MTVLDSPRRPDGSCLDWAIEALQNTYGYTLIEYIHDQHDLRLGAIVQSPTGKQGRLLAAPYAVLKGGYSKSLDAEIVLDVICGDEYLLLGLRNEQKFYMTTGVDLKLFLDDREYNRSCSLSNCFETCLCPICLKPLDYNHNHPAAYDSDALIEVYKHRIKFCNVPLRKADFVNIDRTVRAQASFYEKWLYKKMQDHRLPYFRTAELRDPIFKEQFGYYPDFIPLKGNLVVELDVTTKRVTIEKRQQLLAERDFRLYSIRNLRSIYSEYQKGHQKPLLNLFTDIRSHMKTLEDYT